jgi:hypothetical protein
MSRPKSTTAQGREHEEAMVDLFSFDEARRSNSSGARWNDNTDVVGRSFAMECESTNAASYFLKLKFWNEIVSKSTAIRIPLLGIEFRDIDKRKTTQLVVSSADDFAVMLEDLRGV